MTAQHYTRRQGLPHVPFFSWSHARHPQQRRAYAAFLAATGLAAAGTPLHHEHSSSATCGVSIVNALESHFRVIGLDLRLHAAMSKRNH